MKIAIYVRVSTGRQAEEGVSLEGQTRQIRAWCEQRQYDIVDVYEDPGLSATDDKRPAFRRMIDDALADHHPFDAIVVFSLSRFYRDAIALGAHERRLRRAKVTLISITQPTGEDETGQMVRQILSSFDEYQSKENGKNVRRSMIENARQGYFNGSKPPFGYSVFQTDVKARGGFKRKLEPHADEAPVIRKIFMLSIEGETGTPWGVKKIASYLNSAGHTLRGKAWTRQKVFEILTSSAYYGDYVFNRRDSRTRGIRPESEWVITKIPPIITQEIFDKAASLRQARSPLGKGEYRANASPALLTGLAVCANCGSGFVLICGKGGQYSYYKCSKRLYQGNDRCAAPNIPREELDATVLDVIANKVLDPIRIELMLNELRAQIASLQGPDRIREKALQRQIASTTEQINAWYELVESGKLELHDTLRNRLTASQRRLDQMALELAEIGRRRQLPLKKFGATQIEQFSEGFRNEILNSKSKFAKSYLRAIVSEIRIGPTDGVIKGSHAEMAGAISSWRPGDPNIGVPRHVSNWCGRRDSNSLPLGS